MRPLNTTAPPSGYRVTYFPTNGSPTVTKVRGADELSINLVDLEMGTEYDITVVGINTAGDGEAASTSTSTNIDRELVGGASNATSRWLCHDS